MTCQSQHSRGRQEIILPTENLTKILFGAQGPLARSLIERSGDIALRRRTERSLNLSFLFFRSNLFDYLGYEE